MASGVLEMKVLHPTQPNRGARRSENPRRGAAIVLAAVCMVMILAFTAFTTDLGYIILTKTQLQSAADAAALGAAIELSQGLGLGPTMTTSQVQTVGNAAAVAVAAANPAGGLNAVYVSSSRDVRYGHRDYDSSSQSWNNSWGTTPYNVVEVTLHRDQSPTEGGVPRTTGDTTLPLFFAPVLGVQTASLTVKSTAGLKAGVGFAIAAGSSQTIMVLPIVLDKPTWDNLLAGVGNDNYSYNSSTGAISSGADGILEVDLYPYSNSALTSGNRGTVDLGSPNNSTADLKRQILYGLNATDLAYFGGQLRTDTGPLSLNGDTGISAGIKAELTAIKGKPRLIPIFTAVSGPGNNATYTVVKFVGIRILDVVLTGGNKKVVVQPAPFVDQSVIAGNSSTSSDSYYTPAKLLH
jgi:Flp pilus assembly protein TadG